MGGSKRERGGGGRRGDLKVFPPIDGDLVASGVREVVSQSIGMMQLY